MQRKSLYDENAQLQKNVEFMSTYAKNHAQAQPLAVDYTKKVDCLPRLLEEYEIEHWNCK